MSFIDIQLQRTSIDAVDLDNLPRRRMTCVDLRPGVK
jgi:hypothetical protein